MRQLFSMHSGDRRDPSAALMHQVVEKPTVDDMLAIVADVASRAP